MDSRNKLSRINLTLTYTIAERVNIKGPTITLKLYNHMLGPARPAGPAGLFGYVGLLDFPAFSGTTT